MIETLPKDLCIAILSRNDDPAELMRLCAVSSPWCKFVTKNHLMKTLFLKIADQASEAAFTNEHANYALLIRAMDYALKSNCISEAVSASSTLSMEFGIENTIRFHGTGRVWSSKGMKVPDGTQTLTYKLSELCLVESITINPVQDNSLPGSPIFRAPHVRFLLGDYDANGFRETFKTPLYPMNSDTEQRFDLKKPTLCIAKHMVIEFSGFVEKEPSDGLYYLRVSMVQVGGRSLAGTFRTRDSVPAGNLVVEAITYMDPKIKTDLDILEKHLEVADTSMIPMLVQFVEEENVVLSSDDSD